MRERAGRANHRSQQVKSRNSNLSTTFIRRTPMKKSIILSASLFFLIVLLGRPASAQTIYGISIIQEEEVSGTVQLYTATELDAAAYEYYDAAIAGSIY